MIIHQKGDVVELKGSLDANQWPALKSVVSLQLKQHPTGIVIDGGGLTDINEAGAHTFIDASEYIQAHHARVVAAGLSPQIQDEMRRIPGARSQLPLAASIEEARASLAIGGAEAVPESRRKPSILVPLLGQWRKAVDYAALHADRNTELHLLYVLEIPRSMPLGVPLPDKEQEALHTLDEAEKELGKHGYTVRRMITRARSGIEGAARFAADTRPRLVVDAHSKTDLQGQGDSHDVIGTLAHNAAGDVVIYAVGPSPSAQPGVQTAPCKPAIVVPLMGVWPKAVQFAAEQAARTKKEVHLLYVIQVPRISPLDISMPEKEQEAQEILSEAERVLRRSGIYTRRFTTRSRDVMEGAGKFAAENQPELMVLAYFEDDLVERGARYPIVTTLFNEAPCDIAVYCPKSE
jgi:anti-anti-sigma regulatory factor/nucleotide-binding universal stress UspA family protein